MQPGIRGGGVPFFIGAYAGKERLFQEEPYCPGGRCAALIGAEIGIQPADREDTDLLDAPGLVASQPPASLEQK